MYLLAEKKEENPNYMYFFTQSITVVGWSSCKFKKDEDGNSVIQEEELDSTDIQSVESVSTMLINTYIKDIEKAMKDNKWKWDSIKQGIKLNTFSGCRAFSTLLATLHITETPFDMLSELKKGKTNKENEKYTKPFVYLMQEEMKGNLMNCKLKIEKIVANTIARKADITTQLYNSIKI